MSSVAPGWYRDPAEPTTQRYWDGEGWLGEPLPVDATPPPGPPPSTPPSATDAPAGTGSPGATGSPGGIAAPGEPTASGASGAPASPGAPASAGAPPSAPPASTGAPTSPGASASPGPVVFWPGAGLPPGAPPQGPTGTGYPGGPVPTNSAPPNSAPPNSAPPNSAPPGAPPGLPAGLPPWAYAYVRIPAPVPRPHGYPVANPALRLAARAIDTLAILLLNAVVNGWFIYRWWLEIWPFIREYVRRQQANQPLGDIPLPQQSQALEIVIFIIGVALWFAYEVPAVANNGQTLGKRLVGIKVLPLEADAPLGFRRSIRRWNPMGLPTLLWTCFFVGFLLQFVDCLMVLFGPLHLALHDRSAGTIVVHVGRAARHSTPSTTTPADHNEGGTA